jgi:hypothetical protein
MTVLIVLLPSLYHQSVAAEFCPQSHRYVVEGPLNMCMTVIVVQTAGQFVFSSVFSFL